MPVNGFLVDNAVQKYNYESLVNYNTPDFSTSSTYQVGDYVMYQGKLYKCTTAITTSGAWDSTKWILAILSDDVADLKSDLEQAIEDFAVPTQEAVDNWLDNHPEATTTVQDGSLTEVKFSDALKLKTINNYVTPQMYGAKADGVNDDTLPIQLAFQSGEDVFFPQGTYMVNTFPAVGSSLTDGVVFIVSGNTSVVGENACIICGDNAVVNNGLFFLNGDNIQFSGLEIHGRLDTGSPSSGIRLIDCRGANISIHDVDLFENAYAAVRLFNCTNTTIKSVSGYAVECLVESLGDYAYDITIENVKTYANYGEKTNIAGECVALFSTDNKRWNIFNVYSEGKSGASCLLIGSNGVVSREIYAESIFATGVYLLDGTANYAVYCSTTVKNVSVDNVVVFGTTAFGLCYLSNSECVSISGVDNGSDGVNEGGTHAAIVRVFNSTKINLDITLNVDTRANTSPLISADANTTGRIVVSGNIPTSQYVEILGAVDFVADLSNRFLSISSGANTSTIGICTNPANRQGLIKQRIGWFDGASVGANMCKNGAAIQYYVVSSSAGLDNLNSLNPIKTPEFVVFIRSSTSSAITFTPVSSSTVIWSDTTPFSVSASSYKVLRISSNGTIVFIDAG